MHAEGTAPAKHPPTDKHCPQCDQTRPNTAFYRRRNGHLSSYCRACQRTATRTSYQRRRQDPAVVELMRARDRRRKRQARALVRAGEGR